MTDKAHAGSVGLVAVAAGEDLVGVWCRSCTVHPPLSFFLEGGPTGVLGGGNRPVDGVPPGAASVDHWRWSM